MGKRGPRPQGPYEGARGVVSVRLQHQTKADLKAAAAAAKPRARSLAQEIEHRLRRTLKEDDDAVLNFGGMEIYGICRLISAALFTAGIRDRRVFDDPDLYGQAIGTIAAVLEAFRPQAKVGDARPRRRRSRAALSGPWATIIEALPRLKAPHSAEAALDQVRNASPAFGADGRKSRLGPVVTGINPAIATRIRDAIGDLAERIPPRGALSARALSGAMRQTRRPNR